MYESKFGEVPCHHGIVHRHRVLAVLQNAVPAHFMGHHHHRTEHALRARRIRQEAWRALQTLVLVGLWIVLSNRTWIRQVGVRWAVCSLWTRSAPSRTAALLSDHRQTAQRKLYAGLLRVREHEMILPGVQRGGAVLEDVAAVLGDMQRHLQMERVLVRVLPLHFEDGGLRELAQVNFGREQVEVAEAHHPRSVQLHLHSQHSLRIRCQATP
mmetsp:Transcript_30322/g.51215  ORF Transcript_30322/g.51215 Transcript_30322/m.51215 type:complete len:212 (+) Transcript_30322:1036-1671(+)